MLGQITSSGALPGRTKRLSNETQETPPISKLSKISSLSSKIGQIYSAYLFASEVYSLVKPFLDKKNEGYTLEVKESSGDIFYWVAFWLSSQKIDHDKSKSFSVEFGGDSVVYIPKGKFSLPWSENHIGIKINEGKEEGRSMNSIYLTFDTKDSAKPREFIDHCKEKYNNEREQHSIYAATGYGEWHRKCDVPERLLVLPDELLQEVEKDFERFLESKQKYSRLGLAYRRGYLFSGLAGTGKTSLCIYLAKKYGFNICPIILSSTNSDETLSRILNATPNKSLVLFEDIDSFDFSKARGAETVEESLLPGYSSGREKSVTLSGFLNAIDGVGTKEGNICIITSNYAETIDPAILRPGRVDKKFNFGPATKNQIIKYAKAIEAEISIEKAEEMVSRQITLCQVRAEIIDQLEL